MNSDNLMFRDVPQPPEALHAHTVLRYAKARHRRRRRMRVFLTASAFTAASVGAAALLLGNADYASGTRVTLEASPPPSESVDAYLGTFKVVPNTECPSLPIGQQKVASVTNGFCYGPAAAAPRDHYDSVSYPQVVFAQYLNPGSTLQYGIHLCLPEGAPSFTEHFKAGEEWDVIVKRGGYNSKEVVWRMSSRTNFPGGAHIRRFPGGTCSEWSWKIPVDEFAGGPTPGEYTVQNFIVNDLEAPVREYAADHRSLGYLNEAGDPDATPEDSCDFFISPVGSSQVEPPASAAFFPPSG